jgi:dipeptidyl aminopeptidase/acylaminoacyl peptidase
VSRRGVERIQFMSGGQRVVGVIHPGRGRKAPTGQIVITCHGLLSSKDSDKYLQIADNFSSRGISVLRFDFRGSGESEGAGNLLTNRVMDLNSAIGFVTDRGYKSVGLLGSSYGGTTALLVAGECERVKCLVTWSTPCELVELFQSMTSKSDASLSAGTTGSAKGVGQLSFMEDLSRYNVAGTARKVKNVLVIHCKGDKVVPWSQARNIFDNARQPKRLRIFGGGDHQLLEPSIRRDAIELSLGWIIHYL